MKFTLLVLSFASLLVSGCAADSHQPSNAAISKPGTSSARLITMNITGPERITSSKDWEKFKGEWQAAMSSAAKEIKMPTSMQEGKPHKTGEHGTLIIVYVNDYRYLSSGTAAGVNPSDEKAFIDSSVQYRDLENGMLFGEKRYNSNYPTWPHKTSSTPSTHLREITADMVREIRKRGIGLEDD